MDHAGQAHPSSEVERPVAKESELTLGDEVLLYQSCLAGKRRSTTLAVFELWVAGVGAVSAAVVVVRRRALTAR